MNGSEKRSSSSARPRYVAAMVLGTALSALGAGPVTAAEAPETTVRAVTDISRYCTACWRNARLDPDCWPDCTQEVFSRLLERISPTAWRLALTDEGEERREFLRAIDTVKKRTQRSRKWSAYPCEGVTDWRALDERRLVDDLEAVRQTAVAKLSPRQQRIFNLSREGWSIQEIAEKMDLPAERISDEKYKAIRKLRAHFGPTTGSGATPSAKREDQQAL